MGAESARKQEVPSQQSGKPADWKRKSHPLLLHHESERGGVKLEKVDFQLFAGAFEAPPAVALMHRKRHTGEDTEYSLQMRFSRLLRLLG